MFHSEMGSRIMLIIVVVVVVIIIIIIVMMQGVAKPWIVIPM